MKCMNNSCENELIGKQQTFCSDRCRKAATRTKSKVQLGQMSDLEPTRTNFELCRYCSKPLPALAKLRRNPGDCYDCAIKQLRQASIKALGNTVYAGAERPPEFPEPFHHKPTMVGYVPATE